MPQVVLARRPVSSHQPHTPASPNYGIHAVPDFRVLHEIFCSPRSQVQSLLHLVGKLGNNYPKPSEALMGRIPKPPQFNPSSRAVPVLEINLETPLQTTEFVVGLAMLGLDAVGIELRSMTCLYEMTPTPNREFHPNTARWVEIDLCAGRLPSEKKSVNIDLIGSGTAPEHAAGYGVLFGLALFPKWVKSFGSTVGGTYVPVPIIRGLERRLQEGTEFESVYSPTINARSCGKKLIISDVCVTEVAPDSHFCVPALA